MASKRQYWLLKSEPTSYSLDDLKRDGTTLWSGVRNYQARNFMKDGMRVGDRALFYHSSADPTAIVGICEIVSSAVPDETAMDPKDDHFDPKSTPENPIWYCVEVKYLKHLEEPITLEAARKMKGLEKMELLRRGSRLSIQPVTEEEWKIVTGEK